MGCAIVFLGGIPGAGKTTLANSVAAATGCLHVRASHLIREGRAILAERPDVRDLADAELNQRFLTVGFEKVRTAERRPILIDGHFIVPTRDGLYPVGEDVFALLRLAAVAVLEVESETCAARLRGRDALPPWWNGSTAALADMQAQEHAWCERIAERLRLTRIAARLDALASALASS